MIVRIVALLLCCSMPAAAHDFWVQPQSFWSGGGLALLVGHGADRQRSPIPPRRILRFEAIAPDGGTTKLAPDMTFEPVQPGTHVVVLQTDDRAQSYLPALRFNDYLDAEGLTPALESRRRTGRMQADGSERYSRVAKALVQRGESATTDVSTPLGLPLEIVPERNPYAQPHAATLPVHVLYDGRPLVGALVKFTDLAHDETPFEMQRTDAEGRASFTMPVGGHWLLNVIWTKESTRGTEFETVFSSLSFGWP